VTPVGWLVAVLLAPLGGAAFALVLPAGDRLTLRSVGVFTGLLAFAAAVVLTAQGGASLTLPGTPLVVAWRGEAVPAALTVLAVTPLALRAGAPRITAALPAYVVAVLGTAALSVFVLVLTDVRAAIAAATVAAVPPFALVALFGGPERGSVSYRAAGLWLLVDAAALAALTLLPSWRGPLLVVAALGPGLVRLAAGPWGLWALPVLEQAPVSAACLVAGGVAPVGAVLLWRTAASPGVLAAEVVGPVAAVLAAAAAVGAALVVTERDLRRLVAHLLGVLGALAAAALLAGARPAGLALVVLTGFAAALALMIVEAIERRLETRRVHELAGLRAGAPGLAALLLLALLALTGLPWPGPGAAAWPAIATLARHGDRTLGAAGVVFGLALLVCTVVVVTVAGRAALPPRRRQPEIRVSFLQWFRLLVPLWALVAAALVVDDVVTGAVAAATGGTP